MTTTAISPDMAGIIDDLCSVLSYHQTSGIESYPAVAELEPVLRLRRIQSEPRRIPPSTAREERTAPHRPRPVEPQTGRSPVQVGPRLTSLADLRGEIEVCTACALSEQRIVPTAGRGEGKARLLVVGDWLSLADGQQPPTGCIFGVEQDRMLGKMIDAIGLPRTEVFITNVIKCGIPAGCQPQAEHVQACLSFLHRQMLTLQPEAVLAMGMIAARTLLHRPEPLSKLRGRLHTCVAPDGRGIPLIATYHPTFLLQNPEMKKATWLDLQLLARQLGLVPS